jgi:hypothetical protein
VGDQSNWHRLWNQNLRVPLTRNQQVWGDFGAKNVVFHYVRPVGLRASFGTRARAGEA